MLLCAFFRVKPTIMLAGKGAVDSRRVDFAPGLAPQILVAADVASAGVGVVDGCEPPAVDVQKLRDFAASVLIVAAADQANVLPVQPRQPNLRRTLDAIVPHRNLDPFVHNR